MSKVIGVGLLLIVGGFVWQVGDRLSSDAVSMALGVLFGVLAGFPVALLVLASNKRDDRGPVREIHVVHRVEAKPRPQLPVWEVGRETKQIR